MIRIRTAGWWFPLLTLIALGVAVAAPPGASAVKKKKPAAASDKNSASDKKAGDDADDANGENQEGEKGKKVVKTEAEWRKILTRQQFEVTRHKETELAYTGKYARSKKDGVYRCVCCGQPLFDSRAKFESGTGWPSYYEPVEKDAIQELPDNSEGVLRTEVQCSRCDAHLGHVFTDGPEPTGLRYCINSASLKFVDRSGKADDKKPRGGAAKSKLAKAKGKKSKAADDEKETETGAAEEKAKE